ncbi:hypothetical protein FY534_13740 (plasmid) [Alicyclobacillus sp. TC]|uniref:Membrane protein n=1 Tax=Alicyclobacillus tolerans TaxID=90970 RepID=A0ABT9LYK3_9BACL|nr:MULTISPECIES: hypothetical protein [Alicyclobacillus]MDP9729339.1 putative membrane protein [Alicyclobacillus tengchongensis]QRF24842.1 hypothetical protein FY534_13740 [Alicyclobacillus sp. TC]
MAKQDILMKVLTRSLSGGALEILGIRGVELKEPFITELPANTLHMDRVWRMANQDLFHLEFQTKRESTLHRFLEYDARLANEHRVKIRTVVLYHASVTNAPAELDIGTALYRVENVFLSQLDGEQALNEVEAHLRTGQWEPGDRMRLSLALNMRLENQDKAFDRVRKLIPQVKDETERDLVISAILVLGDQGLTEKQRAQLRKELRKVSKLAEELYEEGRQEGIEKVACNLLAEGVPVNVIEKATGLSREQIEKLRTQIH